MSSIAVIGAGIAGLTAARLLSRSGHDVTVWDKGRRPGGRASSRRAVFDFDHGAQYFTARSPVFRDEVSRWVARGIVAEWTPRLREPVPASARGSVRYVGVPGMGAVAAALAEDLDVRSGVRVCGIHRNAVEWRLRGEDGRLLQSADVVLVATPPAQAVPLLSLAPELAARAAAVSLEPCWSVLLGFDRPLPVDFDAAFASGTLSWVARNTSKPGRSTRESWTVHASADWSREFLEDDTESVTRRLTQAFFRTCGIADRLPEYAAAHRWRHAIPDPPLDEMCLYDEDQGIGAAGDWCAGSRIEGAYLSGKALAQRAATTGSAC